MVAGHHDRPDVLERVAEGVAPSPLTCVEVLPRASQNEVQGFVQTLEFALHHSAVAEKHSDPSPE